MKKYVLTVTVTLDNAEHARLAGKAALVAFNGVLARLTGSAAETADMRPQDGGDAVFSTDRVDFPHSPTAYTTLAGFMASEAWTTALDSLKRGGVYLPLAGDDVPMSRHPSIILGENGFERKVWSRGQGESPNITPLNTPAEVLEAVQNCDRTITESVLLQNIGIELAAVAREATARS